MGTLDERWFLRMIETGGASRGNILIDRQQQLAYQIDTVHQQVYRGVYSNFEEASDELQAMMPDHYRPALEKIFRMIPPLQGCTVLNTW